MKINQISLLAALAAGALFALTPTLRAEDKPAQSAPAERPEGGPHGGKPGDQLKKMAADLNLTEAQKTQLQEGFKAQREAMKDLTPEERREHMKENRKAMDAKLKEILTAEQYAKWEKLRQENRPPDGGKPAKKEKPAN